MRQIKFKAWDKDMREWIEIEKIQILEGSNEAITIMDVHNDWHTLEHVELMQFTGLKDKNGKEIYEGDIIKFQDIRDDKWHKGHIYFDDGAFHIQVEEFFQPVFYKGNECAWFYTFEVIGNIYENPELMEEKK